MAYEWQMTFNSGLTAAGLHFMASTAADTNHGNSYLVWQDATSMRIHESVANTLSPAKATVSLPASNGQTNQYRVTYSSGTITVWRNGAQVLSWTDSSPLASGNFVAWRTNQSNVSFDNLRVTGSPSSYNTLVYLHGDHLGSIGAVTNNSGALLDMTRFLPFGGYRGSDPAFLTESGFTGHKMNNTATNNLGLVYMNARYFSPTLARFISADSIVPNATNPQSYNRYSYVENRPLNFSDPTGHCKGANTATQCLVDGAGGDFGSIGDMTALLQTAEALMPGFIDKYFPNTITYERFFITAASIALEPVDWFASGSDAYQYYRQGEIEMAGATVAMAIIPGVSGKAGGAVLDLGLRYGDDVAGLVRQADNGGGTTVYRALYPDGNVEYVGITNHFERRAQEHLRGGRVIQPIPGFEDISRYDARNVEEALITQYGRVGIDEGGTLNNINHSISPRHSNYQTRLLAGQEILRSSGIGH